MSYVVKESVDFIKFHAKYYTLIRDGLKTQTMRLARKRLDVNEGDVVTAVFPGRDVTLKIRILKIGYKQVKSIDLDDAVREGYNEVSDLKNDLLKFYPYMNQFDRLYYYIFERV